MDGLQISVLTRAHERARDDGDEPDDPDDEQGRGLALAGTGGECDVGQAAGSSHGPWTACPAGAALVAWEVMWVMGSCLPSVLPCSPLDAGAAGGVVAGVVVSAGAAAAGGCCTAWAAARAGSSTCRSDSGTSCSVPACDS